ncbi:unnamed protein product [Polarella glacialis]|uniref:Uncharacterized protein n=1 Tax=Polarella glacialis TaxID=89957 RepID=A0A813G3L0_POLGL|nr:unnamed protein product [Polarella glacialis]
MLVAAWALSFWNALRDPHGSSWKIRHAASDSTSKIRLYVVLEVGVRTVQVALLAILLKLCCKVLCHLYITTQLLACFLQKGRMFSKIPSPALYKTMAGRFSEVEF